MSVLTGLDRLEKESKLQEKIKGNIGYLSHGASINKDIIPGAIIIKNIFKDRLKKLFGPQHGFLTNVQDNMVESQDFVHPYFKTIVHSLYSHTRVPTKEMLEGLDTIIVDLQDVGTRIYTYIYTLTLLMKEASKYGIKVVVLDRPNPINAETIEGNILDLNFKSFVGLHELPVRHALTIGEVAKMAKKYWDSNCDLEIIEMANYKRHMDFYDTKLPWVLPSPNLATIEAAYTFVGTVLFEGTNISEGRGTTRSLEILGHPKIEPYSFLNILNKHKFDGCILRPCSFLPTFQKHANIPCGGYQIHVSDKQKFRPWRLSQYLCREFYKLLGDDFQWKQPPYEYEYEKMPIDLINGTDRLKKWVESYGDLNFLDEIEKENMNEYVEKRKSILIYK